MTSISIYAFDTYSFLFLMVYLVGSTLIQHIPTISLSIINLKAYGKFDS